MLLFTEITAALFETVLIYIFLHSFFAPKETITPPLLHYIIFFAFNYAVSILIQNAFLRMVILTALLMIFTIHLFHSRLRSAFCAAMLFSAILVVVDLLSMGILYFFDLNFDDLMFDPVHRSILVVLAKTVELGIILLLAAIGKQHIFDLPFSKILPLILCQGFSVLICVLLWKTTIRMPVNQSFLLTSALFGLLYINIILYLYLIYMKSGYEAMQEKQIAEHQLTLQIDYYKKLREEQERTRSMWHDIQKQINTISSLIQNEDEQAAACLSELQQQFQKTGQMVRFDNAVISSILNDGIQKAASKGIQVDCEVLTSRELNISPLTLSVVIGNTFDNAIEACERLSMDQKPIKIFIRQQKHLLLYEISNPYDPHDMSPPNRRIHGYGLKNVQKCVADNDGIFEIHQKDAVFEVHITLNV